MKKLLTVLLLGLLFLSCGKKEEEKAPKENGKTEAATENKETIVASTAPLKWLVEKIAGDDYNVIAIVPPNANHELFEPKPDDLKKLENSKLFFTYNLLGFEKKIAESLNNSDKVVNVLSSADPALLLKGHHHHHEDEKEGHDHHEDKDKHDDHDKHDEHDEHGEIDPHVWFSLKLMPSAALEIKNKLVQAYPDKKDVFEKNYNAFLEELAKVKEDLDKKMASKTKKAYMIYHPALNYFIKDYNVEEVSVEYEGKEPTAQQIKEIIDEAKEHNITTILVQPQFPKQSIEIIAKEIPNAKIVEFNVDKENVFENLNQFVDYLD